jgi:hypothetical protein
LERYSKLIKVDVKTVSDHPYPWHSVVLRLLQEGQQSLKTQIEVAAPINPKIGCFKKKQETLVRTKKSKIVRNAFTTLIKAFIISNYLI